MTDVAAVQTEPTGLEKALQHLSTRQTQADAQQPPPSAPQAEPKTEAAPPQNEDLARAHAQKAQLQRDREAREAKKKTAELEEKVKAYEALDKGDVAGILKLLSDRKITMEQLAKGVLEEPEAVQESPHEKALRERLETLEREKASTEEREVTRQNVEYVTGLLKESAEKYPMLSGFARAPVEVTRRYMAHVKEHGEPPDLDAMMAEYEQACLGDVSGILASEASLKALLAREDIKTRALSILGVKPSASPASTQGNGGQGNGALIANPNQPAGNGARKAQAAPVTVDDRVALALQKVRQARGLPR